MSQETTDNFWAAWAAWDRAEPSPPVWRLYYNELGNPICYSMEELPHNYIDIDAEMFALQPHNVRVVDGKIKYITTVQSQKLTPGPTGTPCSPVDVCVIVSDSDLNTKWNKRTYEQS